MSEQLADRPPDHPPFEYDRTALAGLELVRPDGDNPLLWRIDTTACGPIVPPDWHPPEIPRLLELASFLHDGETQVGGVTVLQRALGECGCLDGRFLAEWLFKYQRYIPEDWQKDRRRLIFPGTIWRDYLGYLWVTCLSCHYVRYGYWGRFDRWDLDQFWLGRFWHEDHWLVHHRDPSSLRAA